MHNFRLNYEQIDSSQNSEVAMWRSRFINIFSRVDSWSGNKMKTAEDGALLALGVHLVDSEQQERRADGWNLLISSSLSKERRLQW